MYALGDLSERAPSNSTRAYVALGSNIGHREAHLGAAIRRFEEHGSIELVDVSPWIETEPVGGPAGQRAYLNGVAVLDTTLDARALLEVLQDVELSRGRARARDVRNGPRTLDLDLLLFGAESIADADLVVPHPRMEERAFVLEPFARVAPEVVLPVCGRTVRERLAELAEAGTS